MKQSMIRRIERLEALAQRSKPTPEPINVADLAAGLEAAWASLDAGELDPGTYHGRSLLALREVVATLEMGI